MDDLISRQAAIDAITARADRCAENFSTDDPFWEGLVIAESIVKDLPPVQAATSVQPERKKGKWEPIVEANEFGEPYQAGVYCSRCGEMNTYEPNFCQNCGSDNRGEQDDTD